MSDDREAPEAEGKAGDGGVDLSEELTRRYDPERLSKMVATKAGKGQRLDLLTRQKYEKRLGVDLSRVRLITGPMAEEFTAKQGAEAVTVGASGMIMMRGSSKFAGGAAGESLLAHELTHVAQATHGFHKKASSSPLGSSESEAEAEEHEAQVLEEEGGGAGGAAPAAKSGQGDEASKKDARRHQLTEMVLALLAEDDRIQRQRSGI